MHRIALIDIETSGLNPKYHEILEIGMVLFDARTFKIIDTLDLRVRPLYPERVDANAAKVNGYNAKEWKDAMSLELAMWVLKARTQDAMFCAHNMLFDFSFLEQASVDTGIQLEFDRHKIDLFTLAWAHIPHGKVQSWSLKTICTYLGIEPEPKIHRGLQGAMKEWEVYKKLMTTV